ncbi:MAG: hypothetical protein AAGD38_09705 [Acidobacteriota bacterium]
MRTNRTLSSLAIAVLLVTLATPVLALPNMERAPQVETVDLWSAVVSWVSELVAGPAEEEAASGDENETERVHAHTRAFPTITVDG